MSEPRDSISVRLLRALARAVYRYRRSFLYPQVVLFFLCIYYTITHLEFDTSRNNLVGTDKPHHRAFLEYKKEFPVQDDLVAAVESGDSEKNRQFVERLGARLESETNLFADVFYKGDLTLMGPKALQFVTNTTVLVEMLNSLHTAKPILQNFTQVTNLTSLFRQINTQFRSSSNQLDANTEAMIKALPALGRIARQAADSMERPGTPPSPGVTALFDGGAEAEQSQYITFASNRLYVVTARAAREEVSTDAVVRLRELVQETQAEVPGVSAGVTGEPVLEVDEMAQSQKDTTIATIVAFLICALLFVYGYRETGRPIKASICLVVGLGYTIGFATLVIGHLNILTITFFPMLVGMAIDFGIHLVTRYEEELRGGRSEWEALELAMVNTGLGIFTGCFTTSGAFLAMGLTDFKGIREMGVISGFGLLICLVPMMTLLPVLLLRGRQNVLDHQVHVTVDRRAQLERLWLERPGWVAGTTLAITLAALAFFPRVYFDYNLLHMQSTGLTSVALEQKLIDGASRSVIFGAIVADSLEEGKAMHDRLVRLPTVAEVDSMVPFLTQDQNPKLALISRIKSLLSDVHFAELDRSPVNLDELRFGLQALHAYLTWAAQAAGRAGEQALVQQLDVVQEDIRHFLHTLTMVSPEQARKKLGAFQHALLTDLRQTMAAIREQDDSSPLAVADLPTSLKHRFVGKSGTKFMLQVNPRSNVWDRVNQEAFVSDLRRVAPMATGTPVQLLEYTTLLKQSYIEAAYYATAAIAILVFIHFRSIISVFLALIPVGLGTIWTVGWMGWAGIPFNPANIMTLPLVVGVGVTNGIHILNRFAEEQNPSILARSTGKAVLLSALTTIAGFGSLILAKHNGISSLGAVMAVGTTTCMLVGLTFLPALLGWMMRRGWSLPRLLNKKPSADNARSPLGSGGTEVKPSSI